MHFYYCSVLGWFHIWEEPKSAPDPLGHETVGEHHTFRMAPQHPLYPGQERVRWVLNGLHLPSRPSTTPIFNTVAKVVIRWGFWTIKLDWKSTVLSFIVHIPWIVKPCSFSRDCNLHSAPVPESRLWGEVIGRCKCWWGGKGRTDSNEPDKLMPGEHTGRICLIGTICST